MDRRQKQLERKKKKREKARKQNAITKENYALNTFLQSLDKLMKYKDLPDRNDMKGWHIHNIMTLKNIYKKALELFPNESILLKWTKPDFISCDEEKLSDLLTQASIAIYCDPPRYIPYVRANGANISLHHFTLKKVNTPNGVIWFDDSISSKIVKIGKKIYRLTYASHALDRIMERLELSNVKYSDIKKVMILMMDLRVLNLYDQFMVFGFDKHDKLPFGYAPFQLHNNFAIATTFLLPGMKDTPEYRAITKCYNFHYNITTEKDLMKQEIVDLFKKCGQDILQHLGRTETMPS